MIWWQWASSSVRNTRISSKVMFSLLEWRTLFTSNDYIPTETIKHNNCSIARLNTFSIERLCFARRVMITQYIYVGLYLWDFFVIPNLISHFIFQFLWPSPQVYLLYIWKIHDSSGLYYFCIFPFLLSVETLDRIKSQKNILVPCHFVLINKIIHSRA